MNEHLEPRLNRVKRDYYIYAGIIILGILVNFMDGGIQDYSDLMRGFWRVVGVLLVAGLLDLESKSMWWVSIVLCGLFLVMGIGATIFLAAGGGFGSFKAVFYIFSLLVATIVLGDAFWQSIQIVRNME